LVCRARDRLRAGRHTNPRLDRPPWRPKGLTMPRYLERSSQPSQPPQPPPDKQSLRDAQCAVAQALRTNHIASDGIAVSILVRLARAVAPSLPESVVRWAIFTFLRPADGPPLLELNNSWLPPLMQGGAYWQSGAVDIHEPEVVLPSEPQVVIPFGAQVIVPTRELWRWLDSMPLELNPRQREILQALAHLNARTEHRLVSRRRAAKRADPGSGEDAYSHPISSLVQRGLVASCKGRHGGIWLTPAGEAALEELISRGGEK
jgi:hypothetical protein